MKIKKESILRLFQEIEGAPLPFRELMHRFAIDKAGRARFKAFVDNMASEGQLVKQKGNFYALPKDNVVLVGKLSSHRDGYGFVTPDAGGDDIFIPARYLRGNLHGDRVEVTVTDQKPGGKREGRIVRTVERGVSRVVGRFHATHDYGYVVPDELRITQDIYIAPKSVGKAREGQVVIAELTSYPTSGRKPEGRIIEVLGWPDEPEVEVLTIVKKYELPFEFPPEALAAARSLSQTVSEEDLTGRNDLRRNLTVTIDGETARDFDDAVSVQRSDNGTIRLWVSIADVSHYVKNGSPLDSEAYQRGTSVYFPDRCIPMLPEELSNGICSLNPRVDRLALTAEMLFGKSGELLETSFYPSVINSAARLTYTIVREILVDKDPQVLGANSHLVGDLQLMEELARRLMAKRRNRGSIDFDLPEPQIVLDLQGGTQAIIRAERNLAHKIIEEFMLAANEAVASHIESLSFPSLYRVHESPDPIKLNDFREFIYNFGYEFRMTEDNVEPGELQRLLEQAEGKPEERMVNEVLLRCMKQARYSAENLGHFGLSATSYTHFTSPIRRYPDLVVHRILKGILAGTLKKKEIEKLSETLPDTAVHTSKRERVAMEAEREIVELKKMQFMQGRVGEEFDGFITGVNNYGFYVELVELFVEGMVHVSTMPRDFYVYAEKQHTLTGKKGGEAFRIGDRVRVRVAKVSIERKQIDFVVAGAHESRTGSFPEITEEYPRIPIRGKKVTILKGKVKGGGVNKGKGKGKEWRGTGKKK